MGDDTMTTIRRAKANAGVSTTVKVMGFLLLALAAAAVIIRNPFEAHFHPKQPTVRVLSSTPNESNEGDGGRLITFELGGLNDGKSGTVTIQTKPSWAPIGVKRFHELVDSNFFDGCRFFRVVPNFVVQFGINGDPAVQREWKSKGNLKDDPVIGSNEPGTITFATSGPNTRTTQMFINTNPLGNAFLDKQGFSPIGKVVSGMNFINEINDEYGEKPNQGKIVNKGNEYLEAQFPNLSYIESAKANDE